MPEETPVEEAPATKAWYTSKGVVAGLLTAVLGIMVATGVLSPEAANAESIEALSTTWVDISASLAIIIGGLVSAYGRIKASTKIGK